MAGGNSDSKTEEATPKRLRDARKRGQVAKSAELSGALSLLATLLCVISMAPWAGKRIADFGLAVDRSFESLSVSTVQSMVIEAMYLATLLSLIPLMVAALVYAVSLWLQTGPVFSLDLARPMLERLNPIEGARRLFSVKSLFQLVLILCKASILGAAAFLVCIHMLGDAIRVIYSDAGAALAVANAALMDLLLWCGGLFVLLGLLDLGYQRWQYLRDQRMSLSEVRREHKEEQGDGNIKSQRKNFARAPIPREQLAHIPMASLLILDDQARVVALVYRPKQYPLPLFLVHGSADFGAEILAGARRHKILTVSDSPLVAALFPAAQTGIPIPAAQLETVLAHIQRGAA